MSGNKLLTENTIRRFMKLANVDTLTNNFISENFDEDKLEEENDELVNEEETEEKLEEQEEEEMEVDMGEVEPEEPEMDMEPEIDAEPEMGAADMSLTEDEARLLIDLGERLSAAMDEGAEEEEPEGIEEPADEEAPEEDAVPEDEEAPAYGDPAVRMAEQEELVQEVLKRVAKRLVAAKLQNRK